MPSRRSAPTKAGQKPVAKKTTRRRTRSAPKSPAQGPRHAVKAAGPPQNQPPQSVLMQALFGMMVTKSLSAVAALGVYASHRWQMPVLDGVASMVIGLLLAGVAILLVRESRGLLIGEGIQPATAAAIRALALAQPDIVAAGRPLTMYIGREEVLLMLDVRFKEGLPSETVTKAIADLEARIRDRYPMIRRIAIEAHRLPLAGEDR